MARFGHGKKRGRNQKKTRFNRAKGKKNIVKKPLLPKKGVNQSSYESSFFDFLKVFWDNNKGMHIVDLTKQVASTWEVLLPKPKFSQVRVYKDYKQEFERLKREAEQSKKMEFEEEDDSEAETKTDQSRSCTNSLTSEFGSEFGSRSDITSENGEKFKQKGRKYQSYDEYIAAKQQSTSVKKEHNNSSGDKKATTSEHAKDGIFFPVRIENSFDRLVNADLDNQTEMLKKLKIRNIRARDPLNDSNSSDGSDDLNSPPKIPDKTEKPTILTPSNIILVKNLKIDVQQSDLQELFRNFSKDIVIIEILESKFRGEALVEFSSIEAAEKAWSQMNDVNYCGLPLVLEFARKDDDSSK